MKKNMFLMAGILLLSLLLLPGLLGCGTISSPMATLMPTPTPTFTPTLTPTPTYTPSPTYTPTPTPTPVLLLECTPITVKMQSSQNGYPPNIIALAGQPAGSPVGAVQIVLSNETGESKNSLSITFQITQTFHGKVYPSLLNVGIVNGEWTFSDSKNVYTISGEIAYDLLAGDMTKLFGYYISISGLGTTQVCQSE